MINQNYQQKRKRMGHKYKTRVEIRRCVISQERIKEESDRQDQKTEHEMTTLEKHGDNGMWTVTCETLLLRAQ